MIGYLVAFIIGLISAYLVNYISDVLPIRRQFTHPFCIRCEHERAWQDVLLMKPCRFCRENVAVRNWIVLALGPGSSVFLWINPIHHLGYWMAMGLLIYLAVVAVIDLEYRLVLQPVSYFGFALGLGLGIWMHGWWQTLLGGAAGFAFMLILYYLGALFARWLARRRNEESDEVALGYGDVMLSGVLGLLLGWPGIIAGLVLAILLGGVASLVYLIWRVISKTYQPFMAIPYAPFLVLGTIILLYRA